MLASANKSRTAPRPLFTSPDLSQLLDRSHLAASLQKRYGDAPRTPGPVCTP